jgi:2-keto-4-pentenoate hydratase/2-oxohepta-3-ene-1,7-dioic acid hydratase in catechol pathway
MTVRDILDAGEAGLSVGREIVERVEAASGEARGALRRSGAVTSRDATRLLAPIPEPRLVIGGGLNYRSHLREMSGTPEPSRPTGFIKAAASIVGPDAAIHPPRQAANMVDWEGELACVVEREIAEFNRDLPALASGKTHANDKNYPSRSIEEVENIAGGMLGFIPKGGTTIHPARSPRNCSAS